MYPTPNTALFTSVDEDNDKTVIVSNCTRRHPNIVNAAANLSTNIPQPIIGHSANAMSIDPAHAIADTGAISIFVMKGTKVQNKRRATKPISISLLDGKKVQSTHICDVTTPSLPVTLTGHIVPEMTMA